MSSPGNIVPRSTRRASNRPDAAAAEDPLECGHVRSTKEVTVRVEDRAGAAREGGEAVQLEVAFDDDPVRHVAADHLPDVPECRRPDLPVVVLQLLLVLEGLERPSAVETTETWRLRWIGILEQDRIPCHDRRDQPLSFLTRFLGREIAGREIVPEAFSHCRGLVGLTVIGTDRILQRMTELVQDRLAILCVVHRAGSKLEASRRRAV